MSDATPDLQQIAHDYRDYLAAELALVDAFITMARNLVERAEGSVTDQAFLTDAPPNVTLH